MACDGLIVSANYGWVIIESDDVVVVRVIGPIEEDEAKIWGVYVWITHSSYVLVHVRDRLVPRCEISE